MAQFQLTGPDGSTYEVSAPDEQSALNAFSSFHTGQNKADAAPPPPDKYQQAAIDEQTSLKKAGVDEGAGYTRRLAHGATLGADSTILAGMQTPLEMVKRGTWSPSEAYNYAKAREDQIMGDARKNTGLLGDAAEMLGGGVTGTGAADAGLTAGRFLGQDAGVLARSLAGGADAAGLGAVSGFNEGNGLGDRLENAAKGAGAGLALGTSLPIAGAVAKGVAAPILSNVRARLNPEGFAESQIARGIHDSGLTANDIESRVRQAAAEGQPQFNVADAMGNAGHELLGAAARGPGQGRTDIVEALENRQAGQGRRVANTVTEGFDTRLTPEQMRGAMEDARGQTANQEYGAVRDDAQPVDVSNVIDHINQTVAPFKVAHDRVSPDGITGRLLHYRNMLTDGRTNLAGDSSGGLNDFNAAQMVRHELSDEVDRATRAGENNKARLLGGALRQLDSSLEDASPGFRQANSNFRQASSDIEGIGQGRTAALRGRTEDTIPAFQALSPRGQQAFRTGYADPLIQAAQGSAQGVNKARPLATDAFRDEAAAVAPRNDLMQRKLGREMTMFEARNTALGGSPTAKNLAHDAAAGIDPHLVGQILTGNYHGAVNRILAAGANGVTGNTPAVRQAIANILLQNDRNLNAAELNDMVNRTVQRIQYAQRVAQVTRAAGRGGMVALPEQMQSAPQQRLLINVSPQR